jgi:hypothetical protein
MKRFLDFINIGKRPFLEAAGDKSRDVNMPIPPMVMGLLRNIPASHDRSTYASALKWVFGDGLYHASVMRKRLTAQANQALKEQLKGTQIAEHEMYSKEAHAYYDQQGVPLRQFYMDTYVANPEAYEPPFMDLSAVSGGNQVKINISKLNAYLKKERERPFRFGGYNGLIEYIESGKDRKGNVWAQRQYPKSRFSKPHEDRTGLDVSGAQRVEDEDGNTQYQFADFNPNKTGRAWNGLVFNIMKHSDEQIERAKRGEPVDLDDVVERNAFKKFSADPSVKKVGDKKVFNNFRLHPDVKQVGFKGDKENLSVAAKWNFMNNVNDIKDFAQEEYGSHEDYQLIAFLINLEMSRLIKSGNTQIPGMSDDSQQTEAIKYPREPEEMLRGRAPIFQDMGDPQAAKIRGRYYPSKDTKAGSKSTTDTLIKNGAQIAKDIFKSGGMEALEKEIIAFANGTSPMCHFLGGWRPSVNVDTIKKQLEEKEITTHEPTNTMNVHARTPKPGDYSFASYVRKYKDNGKPEPLTPDTLEFFKNQGFKLNVPHGSKIDLDGLPVDKTTATLSNSLQGIKLNLKNHNGQWMILNPPSDNPDEVPLGKEVGKSGSSFDRSTKPLFTGKQNIRLNANDKDEISFRNPGAWQELDNRIQSDPKAYGFNLGIKMRGVPDTYNDFLKTGAAFVKNNLRRNKKLTDPQIHQLDDKDLQQQVAQGMMRFADSYQFRLGDLNDAMLPHYIKAATGVSDPSHIQSWIDGVKEMVKAGEDPDIIRQKTGPLFNAFAINANKWRLKKCVNYATELQERPEGTGDLQSAEGGDLNTGAHSAGGASISGPSYDHDDDEDGISTTNTDGMTVPTRSDDRSDRRFGQSDFEKGGQTTDLTPDEARTSIGAAFKGRNSNKLFMNIGSLAYSDDPVSKGKYLTKYESVIKHLNRMEEMGNRGVHVAKSELQKVVGQKGPEVNGTVLAVADFIHDRIESFKQGGTYPSGIEDFVNQGGPNYLGNFTHNLVPAGKVEDMKKELDGIRSQKFGTIARYPVINYVLDKDVYGENPQRIESPDKLEKVYRYLLDTNNIKAADYVYKAANKSGDRDYLRVISQFPQPGLGRTADQPRPIPVGPTLIQQTPAAQSQQHLGIRQKIEAQRRQQQQQNPPTTTGPVPFGNPHGTNESTLVDFARYKILKIRRSLLESLL